MFSLSVGEWTYDLHVARTNNQVPQNIPRNDTADNDTDDEYDRINMSPIYNPRPSHFSLANNTHCPSNPFIGTSSSFYYDEDMLQEQRAHAGIKVPNRRSLRSMLEAQATMATQQMRLQASQARDFVHV